MGSWWIPNMLPSMLQNPMEPVRYHSHQHGLTYGAAPKSCFDPPSLNKRTTSSTEVGAGGVSCILGTTFWNMSCKCSPQEVSALKKVSSFESAGGLEPAVLLEFCLPGSPGPLSYHPCTETCWFGRAARCHFPSAWTAWRVMNSYAFDAIWHAFWKEIIQ